VASVFSHVVAGLSLGSAFYRRGVSRRIWAAGALCSVLPDIDVIGFYFGVRDGDFWGHRGFTHSLVFAAATAIAAGTVVSKSGVRGISRFSVVLYLFLATASHPLLDAMTNGGLGVAFFSPFDNHRYFLPWRPIRVSPIGVGRFLGSRGLAVLESELIWIWLPAALCAVLAFGLRCMREGGTARAGESSLP
jgi:inner membrane protein